MSFVDGFLSSEKTEEVLNTGIRKIHFVGILGSGMLPLAKLAASLGYEISGSDARADSHAAVRRVSVGGLDLTVSGHSHGLLDGVELLVRSFAVPDTSPEILDALALGLPVLTRPQLLGAFMKGYEKRIAISGSHGKSTTTALVDKMLSMGGVSPTTVSGATLFDGLDVRIGDKRAFVCEACEYRDAFLELYPTHRIITGIELDHTDYFPDLAAIYESFRRAAERTADTVVLNADFDGFCAFADRLTTPYVTYGSAENADYRYVIKEKTSESYAFCIYKRAELLLEAETALIGEYNLSNITAAAALADLVGIDAGTIASAIRDFHGIDRRMSRIGRLHGSTVFYDYAHHPSEISVAISAVKERYGSCAVVFMPHTYSRTKSLWGEFIHVLRQADFTILLDIYPAREDAIDGVSSARLAREIGESALYTDERGALDAIAERGYPALIIMGAGDVGRLIEMMKSSEGYMPTD